MAQTDCPGSLQAVAIRITRLTDAGAIVAGAGGMIESEGLITFTSEPEVEAGEDFSQKNAAGGFCSTYKDDDQIKWMNHELTICGPDPEIHELLLGGDLFYDEAGVDEVQLVTITGTPGGGSFTLTYAGQTTATIAYNAAASAVEDALEALSNIAPGDVVVTGSAGGPYTVTFGGTLDETDVAQMTANGAGLTGGTSPEVTVTTPTAGVTDNSIGWAMPASTEDPHTPVSVELWTKAIVGGLQHATLPYFHHVFPLTKGWKLGARSFQNGLLEVSFVGGKGYENAVWGNGPRDDWDDISDRMYQFKQVAAADVPTPSCGILAIPTQA